MIEYFSKYFGVRNVANAIGFGLFPPIIIDDYLSDARDYGCDECIVIARDNGCDECMVIAPGYGSDECIMIVLTKYYW